MRYTIKHVQGAFNRLQRAMHWPIEPAYTDGKPNVGAIFLEHGWYGHNIVQIVNEGSGENNLFHVGTTKREAFEAMANMANAVETFKRDWPIGSQHAA